MFQYTLAQKKIAKFPLKNREEAKLLLISKKTGGLQEYIFRDLPSLLSSKDLLLLNNAKVVNARLRGRKISGGKAELFLLHKNRKEWTVLLRGNLKEGDRVLIGPMEVAIGPRREDGTSIVEFPVSEKELFALGEIPLPPYLKRMPVEEDSEWYQTVYAKNEGALAAPTAGLHFTESVINALEKKGVKRAFLTLYLGWASFKILKGSEESVPEESYLIPKETIEEIYRTKERGGRIIAVGTSTVRALESYAKRLKQTEQLQKTDLFIKPGFTFSLVDAMITNFHLPGSTHLSMVCAFGGEDYIRLAYEFAISHDYRFYSYGDAMIIL
jgi:S-adenosylmethionine:tRNA ribosyltransferase-isomerase